MFDKNGLLQFCGIEIEVDRKRSQPYMIQESPNNEDGQLIMNDMKHLITFLN